MALLLPVCLLLLSVVISADGSVGPSTSSSLCSESKECVEFVVVCRTDEYEVRHYSPTCRPPRPRGVHLCVSSQLYFSEMPGMDVYVRSYGGWMLSVTSRLHAHLLTEELRRVGASYNHSYHYGVGYDSPLKLLNRHNEVWYVSEGEPVCTDPQEPTPAHTPRPTHSPSLSPSHTHSPLLSPSHTHSPPPPPSPPPTSPRMQHPPPLLRRPPTPPPSPRPTPRPVLHPTWPAPPHSATPPPPPRSPWPGPAAALRPPRPRNRGPAAPRGDGSRSRNEATGRRKTPPAGPGSVLLALLLPSSFAPAAPQRNEAVISRASGSSSSSRDAFQTSCAPCRFPVLVGWDLWCSRRGHDSPLHVDLLS
ncbi:uncharacterized protein LOC130189711 [Pseudoliparis swirei]|uniref:uncharacterized protein LOC130189711 n=1 Tax=Pseudoliparis swirei TaxID=2059687 RepID=UPI0024BEB0E0|nr:uncharacterized protein LOC130189711 [Pseudoliparis swirei]